MTPGDDFDGTIDETVRRAVTTITSIASKVTSFATRVLVWTVVVCVGGFALGVAALDGGIERVWVVLASVFATIAIGGAVVARWRVGRVRRRTRVLGDEVRTLLGTDRSRTVIETFAVDDTEQGSAIVMSRQMGGFTSLGGPDLAGSPGLAAAVRAMTTFPLLTLQAAVISAVFAFLGAVFALALALQ